MNLLVCYGTRPEWIKIRPLLEKISGKIPHQTLFTGQHKDIAAGNFDFELKIESGVNRLDAIFMSVFSQIEDYLSKVTHVLVQGDTATACAIALSAFHRKISVIHLEAGLRTYDIENPYPEESYRQMISSVSSIHLCPTKYDAENLKRESRSGEIHVVGNTVLDNLLDLKPSYEDFVLVTMHRRENHALMGEWFQEISKLAQKSELKFVLPIHPNPNVQKHRHLLQGVDVIEPLSYEEMKLKLAKCRFIITDSGGIQEEASFLKKRVIVCRKETERKWGGHSVLCHEPKDLESLFDKVSKDYIKDLSCPYGDGHASSKILNILQQKVFNDKNT